MKKLEKDELGTFFYNLEEALHHLECAYRDLLGYHAYQGKTGLELIKAANEMVQKRCNFVIEELLGAKK